MVAWAQNKWEVVAIEDNIGTCSQHGSDRNLEDREGTARRELEADRNTGLYMDHAGMRGHCWLRRDVTFETKFGSGAG